jgi:hypothetical protein
MGCYPGQLGAAPRGPAIRGCIVSIYFITVYMLRKWTGLPPRTLRFVVLGSQFYSCIHSTPSKAKGRGTQSSAPLRSHSFASAVAYPGLLRPEKASQPAPAARQDRGQAVPRRAPWPGRRPGSRTKEPMCREATAATSNGSGRDSSAGRVQATARQGHPEVHEEATPPRRFILLAFL